MTDSAAQRMLGRKMRIIVHDPRTNSDPLGAVVDDVNASALAAYGVRTLPASSHPVAHPLAGFSFRPLGRGVVMRATPGNVVPLMLYIYPQVGARIHWAARVRFAEQPNGTLRLSADSGQAGGYAAGLSNDALAEQRMDLLELDDARCVVVAGSCALRAPVEQYAGLCLWGTAHAATVMWAAVSQA